MIKVAVIGGGPAGMMAAIEAAVNGADVTLFEKNEKLGKKMYISGKGRCNLTNDCSSRDFLLNVCTNNRFMFGAINKFSPQDTVNLCEKNGLRLKTERGRRVFPVSDKSSDVIKLFEKLLYNNYVKIRLKEPIICIEYSDLQYLLHTMTEIVQFDRVVIATGGVSYSATGSTGDGYGFARELGHSVIPAKPALCRIKCRGVAELEGLSLKNVNLCVCRQEGKVIDSEFGEIVFTDDGISGPAALTLSSRINKLCLNGCFVSVDLKPALDHDKLDGRILRDFSDRINKDFINALDALLPEKLRQFVAKQSGIPFNKKVNSISVSERRRLVKVLKSLCFPYVSLDDVEFGIVTSGGVSVKEINPSTMESKICRGLYFAGELLDVDAYTGGYNIQIALSTGYVAGTNASKE